ncbi:serine/threonine-protein phosphatase [Glycomyces sp. TRM65418]|uniref:PP2C family protein-serine/threonine phosphatase n=1 Tax=Glycomyces sp. TRM65418 TaxID=2867006 RepID=UPI001CE4DB78|nr:PP2C family protein-serine/threonine phosphatase [Glycomyces sp. TRM65418]MCC3765085.1 serine/threonine-protein phosphatase [Glycomyces sp. TRM65418]QZD54714.1 serine/threonine-protein phosphatase [Glycomyces sp. TRM65418]
MGLRVSDSIRLQPATAIPLWVRLLPLGALGVASVFQLFTPDPLHAGIAMTVVPVLAAFVLGPVWTAVIAVLALGVVLAPLPVPQRFDGGDLVMVAMVFATAVGISWVRQRFEAGLVTMLSVSEAAQQTILPGLSKQVGDFACTGLYHSAQRGALIGGDLFDVRPSPYGPRLILGDVQGHGLDAVSTASMLLSVFHEAILDEEELGGIAWRLERRILDDAEHGYVPELFASALLAEFPEGSDEVQLLSCGHPSPLILRAERAEEIDLKPMPVLGLRLASPVRPGEAVSVPFGPGETLLAFSDGLVEARNKEGRFYPLASHLEGLVVPSPRRLIEFVWEDVARFAARMDDDVSILAVTRVAKSARNRPSPG